MSLGEDNFEDILETFRPFLLSLAHSEVPEHLFAKGGVSDLVQETLVTAIQRQYQFGGSTLAEVRGWLRAILKTEGAIFRRRFSDTLARNVTREVMLVTMSDPAQPSPQDISVDAEESNRVLNAVAELPEISQRVISLRMEHAMSFAQIGLALDRSEDAARKLFSYAIDKLRGHFRVNADVSL